MGHLTKFEQAMADIVDLTLLRTAFNENRAVARQC